jgi:membrane-bound metal-dependent hydrolase YbcI (DUF457 family)
MLAVNHATSSIAIVLAGSLYLNQIFFIPLLLFVTFAGVMPDIDHPGSELGKFFKPIGKILPHRGITHSILGVVVFYYLMQFMFGYNNFLTYFLLFGSLFGFQLLLKICKNHVGKIDDYTLKFISKKQADLLLTILNIIISAFLVLCVLLVWNGRLRQEIFVLLIVSYACHIVGDFVTKEGVPLFFPIKKKFGLKLFRTGSGIETFLGVLLVLLNIFLLYQFCDKFSVFSEKYWLSYLY